MWASRTSPNSPHAAPERGDASTALCAVWMACFTAGSALDRSLPLRELPDIDLSSADPAVKQAIQTAQSAVLASPRSGAAWGELGEVLEAHIFHQEAQL